MKTIKHCRVQVTRTALNEAHAPYARIVSSSRDIHALAKSITEHEDQEVLLVFYMDCKNRVTGYTEVARGTVDGCQVAIRDVFRGAILQACVGIIVSHNHPSGDPTPSDSDLAITRQIRKAGDVVGVNVLDHVIVAASGYFSFLDSGLMS